MYIVFSFFFLFFKTFLNYNTGYQLISNKLNFDNQYNHLDAKTLEKLEKMFNDKNKRYSPFKSMSYMKYKNIINNSFNYTDESSNITEMILNKNKFIFKNYDSQYTNDNKFFTSNYANKYINEDQDDNFKKSPTEGNFEIIRNPTHTFKDIGGYDKIKSELMQVSDILLNYEKYKKYNVRTPKGIIFEGPPGNGKTLMAKCFCGEINASFIPVSGSEFSETFVGVGAGRVRELFKLASKNKPCIIFIDEIDAVARKRGNDAVSSNSEKDQTLNQLLINLDGFKKYDGIFLIGATNRIDLLDPALLRPGRIDKNIYIGNPDSKTRKNIIDVHLKGKPIDKNINIDYIVEITGGFSGAQIENLLNEAMLNSLRNNREIIYLEDLEYIINRIIAGWQSTENKFSDDMIERIVIHEMGHAILGLLNKEHSKLVKVCLNLWSPKSPGYTVFENTDEDSSMYTKDGLVSHLMVLLGGRIAEELFYGYSVTTGAKKDLELAYKLAYNMIIEYGMGKKNIYPNLSDQSKYLIDQEISSLLLEAHDKACSIITDCKELIFESSIILKNNKILKPENIIDLIYKKYPKIGKEYNDILKNKY